MALEKRFLDILQKSKYQDEDYAILNELATHIRKRILEVVSKNGGHLSPTLGAVELIIGMHCVFDSPNDPLSLMLAIKPMPTNS